MTRLATVATYNLLHGLNLPGGGTAVDLAAAADAISRLGADVVALQEVDRLLPRSGEVDQVAWLAAALGWHGAFAPALLGDPERQWQRIDREDPGGPAYGIGLLARNPLVDVQRTPLPGGGDGKRTRPATPSSPGWDREPRAALTAVVRTPIGDISVTTAHLSYLPWRALAQLRAVAGAPHSPRAVIAGDLNLPARPVRMALRGWTHHAAPATYPSWEPRLALDHVLSRRLQAVRTHAWPHGTSDHLPLLASLRST